MTAKGLPGFPPAQAREAILLTQHSTVATPTREPRGERQRPFSAGMPARRRTSIPALIASDMLLTAAAFWLGGVVGGGAGMRIGPLDSPALAAALAAPVAIALVGGYPPAGRLFGGLLLIGRLLVAGMCCAWIGWLVAVETAPSHMGQLVALSLLLPVGWTGTRYAADVRRRRLPERALVIGSGSVARRVAILCARHPEHNIHVVGCVDDDPLPRDGGGPEVLGDLDDLGRVVVEQQVSRVIVAFAPVSDAALLAVLRRCDHLGVDVNVVPRLFDLVGMRPSTRTIGALSFLEVEGRRRSRSQPALKRGLDIAAAAMLVALLAPVLTAVAAAVLLSSGRPVLFRQQRVGRAGEIFTMLKFRTMTESPLRELERIERMVEHGRSLGEAIDGLKRGNDIRVTRIGRFLRRTSLDELPQFLNVLGGSMSLVGPRPLPLYEAPGVQGWQLMRQEVRPGITGLWQVLGRSDIPWDERLQIDYSYVRHWSMTLDLRILGKTMRAVMQRQGAV